MRNHFPLVDADVKCQLISFFFFGANSFDMPLSSKTMSKTTQNKREYNPDYIK